MGSENHNQSNQGAIHNKPEQQLYPRTGLVEKLLSCNGFGAGEGNRTLVCSLGSCRSTIELRPHVPSFSRDPTVRQDQTATLGKLRRGRLRLRLQPAYRAFGPISSSSPPTVHNCALGGGDGGERGPQIIVYNTWGNRP